MTGNPPTLPADVPSRGPAENPGQVPSDELAPTFSSAIEDAVNYTQWLVDVFRPYMGKSLLEVGVGHGRYHEYFPQLEHYVGLDLDPALIEQASKINPDGLFVQTDLAAPDAAEKVRATLKQKNGSDVKLDTVVCFNVVEHIEDDRAAVANMARLVEPGGHVLILVPAHPALYMDLDRLAGHHRRYTRKTLSAAFPESVELLDVSYINPIGGLGWWANRFTSHDTLDDDAVNAQIRFFDKFVLPFSRMATPLTRRVFGQSVIAVGKVK